MASPDILFKGIPRGPTRGYTSQVIMVAKPRKVVVPCIGSFALAHVATQSGVQTPGIVCGDISLYSTALGNAIMGTDWRLEIKGERGEAVRPLLTDPISKAAAILFMVRVLQYDRKKQNAYLRDMQRELLVNQADYVAQLKDRITELRDALKGLTYKAQDMWLTLEEHRNDPHAILLVNPPRYDGGYDRMFQGIDLIFDWDAPQALQFREKDYARLMELLGGSTAHSLMYYATQGDDLAPMWGSPWRSVFADRPGNKRRAAFNWIVANRETPTVVSRTKLEEGKARFPMFDGEVTPDSELFAMRVDHQTGDYYRDLFIHKLPGGVTEFYTVVLIDGYLFAVVGLHLTDFRVGRVIQKGDLTIDRFAFMPFAFTVTHERYTRLHKLTLMCAASSWFYEDVLSGVKNYDLQGIPANFITTMLTPHPENKTARGIMMMTGREKLKDGTYRLTYNGRIKDRTRQETLREWLNKYGTLTK